MLQRRKPSEGVAKIPSFTGSTSGPELRSSGDKHSLKINHNRPVPKPRSSWLLEKHPELPIIDETMKPIQKPRLSLSETNENIVVNSEVVGFKFAENSEDEQKENEFNKNVTADVSKEVITEETEEKEN